MSIGIVKMMLNRKADEARAPEQSSSQTHKEKKTKPGYKELMTAEMRRREDAHLLRHSKKKSGIRKLKERRRLPDKANKYAHQQRHPTIVEKLEIQKKKSDEEYKVRTKAWKDEFHAKGNVASSITQSVRQSV